MKAASTATIQTTLTLEEIANSVDRCNITFIHKVCLFESSLSVLSYWFLPFHGTLTGFLKFPGFVNTGSIDRLLHNVTGIWKIPAMITRLTVFPLAAHFLSTTIEEAGERGVFIATSARYPPALMSTNWTGIAIPEGVNVAKSSVVENGQGNGVYRLDGTFSHLHDPGVVLSLSPPVQSDPGYLKLCIYGFSRAHTNFLVLR